MAEPPLDAPTIREGISTLNLSDQRYVVLDTLQKMKAQREGYDDPTDLDRDLADIAHEVLKDLPIYMQDQVTARLGLGAISGLPDPNAQRQLIITYGVLSVFVVVTLSFVLGVAFQVKGVEDLGTAFTTLLAAVTGFFAGRGEGQATSGAPSEGEREQRVRREREDYYRG